MTTTWAVLLRGVNVGGRRRVPMKEWKAVLEDAGCTDVQTYLQSGQAVLTSDVDNAAELCGLVQDGLRAAVDVDTVVMARTGPQLAAVLAGCPWPEVAAASPTLVHACFVDAAPSKAWLTLDPAVWAPDEVVAGEGVVYVRYETGAGRTKVPLSDRQLGTPGTSRNWNTVVWLVEHSGTPVPE